MARAWVNFNGTGTVAIRASVNVSSITDNGTGDYTVNFATAMPDANYSCVITGENTTFNNSYTWVKAGGTQSASAVAMLSVGGAGLFDSARMNVVVFR
jgi:hypothetical protein